MKESDPFGPAVESVVKIKGVSLKHITKSLLSTKLLEEVLISECASECQSIQHFFSLYAKVTPDGFLASCQKIWREERVFALPQPGLKKNRKVFQIQEDRHATKRISSSFNKRVLKLPVVCQDNPDPQYPSLPFGFVKR